MKLPYADQAVVEQAKICEYLLNPAHRFGASKARFFVEFGFTLASNQCSSDGGKGMIHEHDCIVLTQDIGDEGLKAGDVGTVVHIHPDAAAYEVEFMTLTGQTLAVTTVLPTQIRPVSARDVSHVRELAIT